MKEIWLVRHGETAWSKSGQHTSLTDLPLTEQGRASAAALQSRLAGQHFDLVLTSPLRRARETAELAGFADAVVEPGLVEWNYGAGEGLTSAQIREVIPDWRIWTHGAPQLQRGLLPVAGDVAPVEQPGESLHDVTIRLASLIARLTQADHERVLMFAHGHILRAFAALWCAMPVASGSHFPLETGAVSVLGFEKTTPALIHWNS